VLERRFFPPSPEPFDDPPPASADPPPDVAVSPDEAPPPDDSPRPAEPPSLEPDELVEPDDPEAPSPEPLDAAAFVFALEELDRSFFAQPEPLKWTAGGAKSFLSVSSAPQAGQNRGAGASMPWMNSVRVEQFEQT
jgi:hypothetical protein